MYCLAVAAMLFGVLIHKFSVMSNHYHIVLTDVHGRLPEFMAWLNKHVAKAVNRHLGRRENLFDNGKYSAVILVDAAAVRDKMGYVLANPVAAGLVEKARQWPGCWSHPNRIDGAAYVIERPDVFFRKDGPMPEEVTLQLTAPPCFGDMPTQDLRQMIKDDLAEREDKIRAEMANKGRRFLGVRAIRAQSPFGSPKTREPRGRINPRIACRDKWKRIERIRQRQAFLSQYRHALALWREGNTDVVFPAGTYWMRHHANVRCADDPCPFDSVSPRPPPPLEPTA